MAAELYPPPLILSSPSPLEGEGREGGKLRAPRPEELTPATLDLSRFIRPGDAIIVGQGGGEPVTLTEALAAQRASLGRVRVFLGPSFAGTLRPEHADHIGFSAYAASGSNLALARAGLLDIVPCHYSALPSLFADGHQRADVALLLLGGAPGRFCLGMGVDHAIDAARRARVVIAEWSTRVPETPGSELPPDIRLDAILPSDREPATLAPAALGEEEPVGVEPGRRLPVRQVRPGPLALFWMAGEGAGVHREPVVLVLARDESTQGDPRGQPRLSYGVPQ